MSFDVYIQCHEAGKPAGIPRAIIRRLFPVVEAESERDCWRVRYTDLHACTIYVGTLQSDVEMVHWICLDRPCGIMQFWDSVFEVMQLGNVVLYFPGCASPLIALESVGPHLPADMVESLGQPVCVQSGKEIVEIIER